MTLQQKMLAKQSKKGFTLVELVVVIAILAILAAIAIPAIVGIINNANESQKKTDAATVDNACKGYYAAIVAGSLNSSSADASKLSNTEQGKLPAANAASNVRKSAALTCTVGGALDWNGTSTLSGKLTDFRHDAKGNIFSATDEAHTSTGGGLAVDATDTFASLGYN